MSEILFSCVAENRADFAMMAHNLVLSIRAFAGELSRSSVVVNFVDDVDERFARPILALDAEVRVVKPIPGPNPLANKLRMLELHNSRQFDVLIALDCDVVALGNPAPWIDPRVIGAKAADFDQFTDTEWRSLFAVVGVPEPPKALTATGTGQKMYPYFNSGVLFVPHALCARLREGWMHSYAELSEILRRHPRMLRRKWHWLTEQASLSLAILRDDLPWRALPHELNFPTHIALPSGVRMLRPIIIHYHDERDDSGFLLASRTPSLNPRLDTFNRHRAQATGQPYAQLPRRSLREQIRRATARRLWRRVADLPGYDSTSAARIRRWINDLVEDHRHPRS